MNGYDTTIFEMHSIPGGLCTAWKRKGYTWDISMHMLTNSRSGPFREMWEELGVTHNRQFHYHDEIMRIESGERKLTVGLDPVQLQKSMIEISPKDTELIREFIRLFYGKSLMNAATLNPAELSGIWDKVRMISSVLPMMGVLAKYSKITVQEFARKFSDPFLQKVVQFSIDSPGWRMLDFPMVAFAGMAHSAVKNAGVPLGGSQNVIFDMVEKYKSLGGLIEYRSKASGILIENGKAAGVRLENGSEHRADVVIWAGDGHHLIFDLLKGKYVSEDIRTMYEKWIPVNPLVHVMLGVNRDMSQEPKKMVVELEHPIRIADEDHKWMTIIHRSFDPGMAPSGKTSLEVWFSTSYDYWASLSQNVKEYKKEKYKIARQCIDALDKRWPGIAKQIEVIDVPTPATYVRYTGNWRGSPDGWYVTPANMTRQESVRTLPGLDGLYMAGQWTAPFTGTVIAALSGRQVIQIMCRKDGRKFRTGV